MNEIWRWIKRGFGARIGWVVAGLVLAAIGFDVKADTEPPFSCPAGQSKVYVPGNGGTGTTSGSWRNEPEAPGPPSLSECSDHNDCVAQISNPGFYSENRDDSCSPAPKTHTHNNAGNLSVSQGCLAGSNGSNVFTMAGSWIPECRETCEAGVEAPGWRLDGGETMCFESCLYNAYFSIGGGDGESPKHVYYQGAGQSCGGNDDLESGFYCDPNSELCGFPAGLAEEPEEARLFDGEVIDNVVPPTESTDDVRDVGCLATSEGGRVCISGATLQDGVPDNGTPGQPAQPNSTTTTTSIESNTTNTYNYYNPAAVNGSTNEGEGEPEGDGEDSTGECDPAVEECGTGRGADRFAGQGGTARTFGEVNQAFYDGLEAAPVGQFANELATMFPDSGVCPTWSINLDLLNTTATLDAHCTIMDEHYNTIRALFALFWLLVAAVVFFKA